MAEFAIAQDSISLMFYNLLNFPDPVPAGREDTLRKIIAFAKPDLFMVCELKTEAGADSILEVSLNESGAGSYEKADFVPMQSSPGSSNPLQQLLFYESSKFELKSQSEIITPRRDINEYILFLKDPNLSLTHDTTFLDVYVTHLKSSQGGSNEIMRREAVEELQAHLVTRPQNRSIVFAGDFNIYNNDEPAFELLTNPVNGPSFKDPASRIGDWHSSYSYRDVHTQSTRISPIFNDGAGGGLDDRFDWIMLTEDIISGTGRFEYVSNSYQALGNDGNCFNDEIINCPSSEFPDSLVQALYFMSDHLPVVLQLAVDFDAEPPNGIHETKIDFQIEFVSGNVITNSLQLLIIGAENADLSLQLFNAHGDVFYSENFKRSEPVRTHGLDVTNIESGIYFIQLFNRNSGKSISRKFIKTEG